MPVKRKLQMVVFSVLTSLLVNVSIHPTAQAEGIYVVRGPRGSVTFTSRKPESGSYHVVTSRGPRFSRFYSNRHFRPRPMTTEFDQLIIDTASAHQLEPALVKAVMHVESAFDPSATSYKGAMGLMQLMPGTASRFGVSNAYQPGDNVSGGVRYLRLLLDRYNGDLRLALAAYNSGEGTVDRFREVPPIRETQNYVRRVLQTRELYLCEFSGRKTCRTS